MGCDIHSFGERRTDAGWVCIRRDVLDDRNYGLFGWLANVRNYAAVIPLSAPRGVPSDMSLASAREYNDWYGDAHSAS